MPRRSAPQSKRPLMSSRSIVLYHRHREAERPVRSLRPMWNQLTTARLGIALLVVGACVNLFGLTQLSPTVEGTYTNRSVDAAPGDVAVAASVDGTGWLIAGTALMAVGGVALAWTARRA